MKPALLFLCHRIPYPPDKGDKIRSYHLFKYLAEHFRIYLAAFIDDKNDWQYTEKAKALCEDAFFQELNSQKARLKSLKGLFSGEALTIPYYADSQLGSWVDAQVSENAIDRVIVYSSAMAQYVAHHPERFRRMVIDFVDVDSDKWQQYAEKKRWPMNWIYRREGERLLAYDQKIARLFDASLLVSSAEADLFRQLAPKAMERIGHYNNGVDTRYFSPDVGLENPYSNGVRALVFTGAMDYWPNVDAVEWFARDILPRVREHELNATFYIVGSNPTERVLQLNQLEGVVVTGRVEDVRPYIQYATAAVAPMRIARGVQNKVLEAMAMAKPVIVSPQALEGIAADSGVEVLLACTEQDYVRDIQALLRGGFTDMGRAARTRVEQDFNWDHTLPPVRKLLEVD